MHCVGYCVPKPALHRTILFRRALHAASTPPPHAAAREPGKNFQGVDKESVTLTSVSFCGNLFRLLMTRTGNCRKQSRRYNIYDNAMQLLEVGRHQLDNYSVCSSRCHITLLQLRAISPIILITKFSGGTWGGQP